LTRGALSDLQPEIPMDLSALLRSSQDEVDRMLETGPEPSIEITEDAVAVVWKSNDGSYLADLRVKGNTVVLVRADDLDRFRKRLKEQVAIHVPRDQQPDLTGP
jgi:hypothetical protein